MNIVCQSTAKAGARKRTGRSAPHRSRRQPFLAGILGILLVVSMAAVAQQRETVDREAVRPAPDLSGLARSNVATEAAGQRVSDRLAKTSEDMLAPMFLDRLGDREIDEDLALELTLATLYDAGLLAGRSKRQIDQSRLELIRAAAEFRARRIDQDSKMMMVNLRTAQQQRDQLVRLAAALSKSIEDSRNQVIRNVR